MDDVRVIDTTAENILAYGVCGYNNSKHPGYLAKVAWLKDRFREGLRLKTLYSSHDGTQGMIEYIPGEFCWRPVHAEGYLFIHCLFVGFKKAYKNKGYGSALLKACLDDARQAKRYGVAVVTRQGPFMASSDLFIKHGFEVVDRAPPDFRLLVKRFRTNAPRPRFTGNWEQALAPYGQGLTILRAGQCPYSVKNVAQICATARQTYGLEPRLVNLKNCQEAQNSPCPFGTFCIIHNGSVVADHPISNTRFINIMNKLQGRAR